MGSSYSLCQTNVSVEPIRSIKLTLSNGIYLRYICNMGCISAWFSLKSTCKQFYNSFWYIFQLNSIENAVSILEILLFKNDLVSALLPHVINNISTSLHWWLELHHKWIFKQQESRQFPFFFEKGWLIFFILFFCFVYKHQENKSLSMLIWLPH